MDFLKILNFIKTDEKLKQIIDKKIKRLENQSKEYNNSNILGFNISHNPNNINLLENDLENYMNVSLTFIYDGYIPKNTKIVYGLSSDNSRMITNKGMYYMVDDDSYIYDFCKYIKEKDISLEEDFFEYVLLFLKSYFGVLKDYDRDSMFNMILKNDIECFNPINEHKLSDFKNKGNAMCSEYTIMANNILNVFGINSSVIIGQIKQGNKEVEGHAFNIINFYDRENKEEVNALIDFANGVNVYDINYNKLGESPYIMYLDDIDSFIDGFIEGDLELVLKEYDQMVLGDSLLQLFSDFERIYFSCSKMIVKSMSKTDKKKINMI